MKLGEGDSPASNLMMPTTPYILETLQSLPAPAAASSAREKTKVNHTSRTPRRLTSHNIIKTTQIRKHATTLRVTTRLDLGREGGWSRRSERRRRRRRRRASGSRSGRGTPAARAHGCRILDRGVPQRAAALRRRRRSPSVASRVVRDLV